MSAAQQTTAPEIDARSGLKTYGYTGKRDAAAASWWETFQENFSPYANTSNSLDKRLHSAALRALERKIPLSDVAGGVASIDGTMEHSGGEERALELVQLAVYDHQTPGAAPRSFTTSATNAPAQSATAAYDFALTKGRLGKRFLSKPDPRDYVLGQFLHAATPHLLAGFGGISKTQLMLESAAHICIGRPYADMATGTGGAVVLILGEEEAAESDRRVAAIVAAYKFTPEQIDLIDSRLQVHACAGEDIRLTRTTVRGDAEPSGLVDRIATLCVEHTAACGVPVRLIGLDHYLQVAAGELVSPEDGAAYGRESARLAKLTGAAVLTVTHMPKSAQNKEEHDRHDVAGAGSINNTGRGTLIFIGMSKPEAKAYGLAADERKQYVKLACVKNNKGPQNDCIAWFRRVSHAYQVGVLEHVTLKKKPKEAPSDEALLNTLVGTVAAEPGQHTLFQFTRKFAARWKAGDPAKAIGSPALTARMGELIDTGRVILRKPTEAEREAHGHTVRVREVLDVPRPLLT